MAFERLDSIAKRVISRIGSDGDGEVAALPVSPKEAEPEGSAQVLREVPPANKAHADRSMPTARPTRLPTSAVVIDLHVWKGSRTTEGRRSPSRPAYRRNPRAESRGTVVKFVSG